MDASEKILTLEALQPELLKIRKSGRKIVFTNGCFDILHVGHVRYLAAAKSAGHILVVGLNSDESVKIIKGPKRPIVNQHQRAEVLASLQSVDYVTLFGEADPLRLITALKPDVLVKGADWEADEIVGADVVTAQGGKVMRIEMVADASTSTIIERIVERCKEV
ncbi:MAG: D-glycero-beta-D-manno-heptose 1-phosphate adenylyltransferase [Desulfobacteraceae bacterium]|jgi:D-beta-D-heptose 7-phosphate kinase/D-beta-D-heptose 1-phosphate adenosyltransferase